MSKFLLNVGLDAHGKPVNASEVYTSMLCLFGKVSADKVESHTEPTLYAEFECDDERYVHICVEILAEMYEQDCIAVWNYDKGEGRLLGPDAARWGEFDPEFFIMNDGHTLESKLEYVRL